MRRGPTAGVEYDLPAGTVTIGRGTRNDIVITDNEVSREHCRLVPRGSEGYELQDLESRTGTFVDGQRVQGRHLISKPTLIELGDSITLEFDPTSGSEGQEHIYEGVSAYRGLDGLYLVLKLSAEEERIYPLKAEVVTIGRDLSCDIVIQDPEVSRLHVRLHRTVDGYQVEDVGSTNGTFVNGKPLVSAYLLQFNDLIELAPNAQFRYVHEPETETPSPDKPPIFNSKIATAEAQVVRPVQPEFLKSYKNMTQLGSGLIEGALVDHIFIAYARPDWESIVVPLLVVLQDSGIQTWVEQYLMPGDDDWRAGVEQALRECWMLLLIMSPQSMNSRHVKLQYRYFLNREKPVIPLGYKSVSSLPPEFATLQIVPYDPKNQSHSFQRLIHEIMQRRT